MPADPKQPMDDMFREAIRLRLTKQPEPALALFRQFIDARRGEPDDPRVARAYGMALVCINQRKDFAQTEGLAREALEIFPDHADALQYLGESLWRLGQPDEARAALQRAIEINPEQTEARALLAIVERGGRKSRRVRQLRAWPARQSTFDDPREAIRRHLLKRDDAERFIAPDTVFMTFGSCFAENLAIHLRKLGYRVNSEIIGEEVNSTYANRYLLQWIEHGPTDGPTEAMEATYGPAMRERFRAMLAQSDAVVLTLGVAPCFFDEDTGEFVFISSRTRTGLGFLHNHTVMRTTTVAENVANIHAVLDAIGRLSQRQPKIILTVSPVPLAATTEFHSAIIADCLSKSTLRLACHEVLTARAAEGALYWPSFEIVRWIGVHFDPAHGRVFGEHDGSLRHVSPWVIEMIMELFIEEYVVLDPTPTVIADGRSDQDLAPAAAPG